MGHDMFHAGGGGGGGGGVFQMKSKLCKDQRASLAVELNSKMTGAQYQFYCTVTNVLNFEVKG